MRKLFFCILFILPLTLLAQKKITGKVTDQNGVPLQSANVQEKGKLNTVSTDANGNYSITVQGNDAVLVISSAEFVLQEIKVGDKNTVNAQLQRSGNLEEVVVTAFGVKRKNVHWAILHRK